MFRFVSCPLRWRRCLMIAVAVALPLSGFHAPADAQVLKQSTSLQLVPETAAVYVAGMRYGEIFDKVMTSNAMARLRNVPVIQLGLAMAAAQWENPEDPQVALFKQFAQAPENQQLLAVLQDAVSHEVFVYGDAGWGDLLDLINELNVASSAGQMEAFAAGDFEEIEAYQGRKISEVLNQKGNLLKVPTLVLGMKLTNVAPAVAQLARLEAVGNAMAAQQPMLQGRFARERVGATEYLTLRLDGSLVPWPMLGPGASVELVEKLTALKLVISIGVRDNYLIVALAEDNQHLAGLGTGALLHDRPELAPVRAAADKPLVAISYLSGALAKQIGSIDTQLDQLAALGKQFVPLSNLSFEVQEELAADIDAAVEYLKSQIVDPPTASGYAFLTPEGFESFTYNWSTDTSLDASQPLSILAHLGGDPIAFSAARDKPDPAQWDALGTAISRTAYYAEQLALGEADEMQLEAYARAREQFEPLLERLGSVTRQKLMPAFADGQSALVLDAKSTSDSWHLMMPMAEDELPMIEAAIVMGVSDAKLVKEAFADYFEIGQEVLDKLHELSTGEMSELFPNEIPAWELTPPQARQMNGATVYYYSLPAEAGLDQQIAPNAGLSDQVMAVSLLPRFTARLLADTPLQGSGPLANTRRPLAAAAGLEFARLIEAVEPWIDYGLQLSMAFGADMDPSGGLMGNIPQQVHDVLDVLKCFRGVAGVTYQEGEAMVTHAQWRFEDLP